MKFTLLLLLMSTNLLAAQIQFSQISVEDGFDIRFKLTHESQHSEFAILDCQSFIQKIDFFDAQNQLISENPINIYECEYLHSQVIGCFQIGEDKCFDTKDLFRDSCLCN